VSMYPRSQKLHCICCSECAGECREDKCRRHSDLFLVHFSHNSLGPRAHCYIPNLFIIWMFKWCTIPSNARIVEVRYIRYGPPQAEFRDDVSPFRSSALLSICTYPGVSVLPLQLFQALIIRTPLSLVLTLV